MSSVDQALDQTTRALVIVSLQALTSRLSTVSSGLSGIGVPEPATLARLKEATENLRVAVLQGRVDLPLTFTDPQLSILRTGLALHRRSVAESVEGTQRQLADPELIESVKKSLEPLDALLNSPFLDRVNPQPLPRITNYLSGHGRQNPAYSPTLAAEELDPKHKILLSSSLIARDTSVYRQHCEDRRVPFAVVFADIDDFKSYNTAKSEVFVDRFILPPILNAVEAACYGHGRAYRHGGDEFVLLLPNAAEPVALNVATGLARSVADLRLEGLPHQPRVSIGVWITHPESHLTSTELVEAAATAKLHSKELGKNRITLRVERASFFNEQIHEVIP